MMKIGVAPVIDPDAPVPANDPDGVVIIGAIVVAYAQTAQEAQQRQARCSAPRSRTTTTQRSSRRASRRAARTEEDTAKAQARSPTSSRRARSTRAPARQKVTIDGVDYYAAAVAMPRSTTNTRRMPKDYPAVDRRRDGARRRSPTRANTAGTIKLFIILLGARRARDLDARPLPVASPARRAGRSDRARRHRHHQRQRRPHVPPGRPRARRPRQRPQRHARAPARPPRARRGGVRRGRQPDHPGPRRLRGGRGEARRPIRISRRSRRSPSPTTTSACSPSTSPRARRSGSPDDVSFENFIAKLKVNEGKLKAQYHAARCASAS